MNFAALAASRRGNGATTIRFHALRQRGERGAIGTTIVYKRAVLVQDAHDRRVLESMLTRPWWTTTIFYEAFDEPPAPYHTGVCVDDPDAGLGYDEKPVAILVRSRGARV